MAGITKDASLACTACSQSVWFAKHDLSNFVWFQVIDNQNIDRLESMVMMGSSSSDFLVKTSSSQSGVPITLYSVNKAAGSFTKAKNIDSTINEKLSYLDNSFQSTSDFRYQPMIGSSPQQVYTGISKTTIDELGILKYVDPTTSDNVEWYTSLACIGKSQCKVTALARHQTTTSTVFAATLIQSSMNVTQTYASVFSISSSGTVNWGKKIEQISASSSSFLTINAMLSFGGGGTNILAALTNESPSNPQQIQLSLFKGLLESAPLTPPTTSTPQTAALNFLVGQTGKSYVVNQALDDPDNLSNGAFLLVYDQTTNSGTSQIMKIDFQNLNFKTVDIILGSGSSFKTYMLARLPGPNSGNFYFAGKTKGVTNTTISKTFTKSEGFVMKSDTSVENTACLSFSQTWSPDLSSGTTFSADATLPWVDDTSVFIVNTTNSAPATSSITSFTSKSTTKSTYQTWCTGLTQLKFTTAAIVQPLTYKPGASAMIQYFDPWFKMTENCDGITLNYSLNNTVTNKTNYVLYNQNSYPQILYDSSNSSYYLSIQNANTSNDLSGAWSIVLTGTWSTGTSATLSFSITVQPYCTNVTSPIQFYNVSGKLDQDVWREVNSQDSTYYEGFVPWNELNCSMTINYYLNNTNTPIPTDNSYMLWYDSGQTGYKFGFRQTSQLFYKVENQLIAKVFISDEGPINVETKYKKFFMRPNCNLETINLPTIDNVKYPVPDQFYNSTTVDNFTFPAFLTNNNPYCAIVYTIGLNGSTNTSQYLLKIYSSTTPGFDWNNYNSDQVYLSIYNNTNFYANTTHQITIIASLFNLTAKTLSYSFQLTAKNNCSGTVISYLAKNNYVRQLNQTYMDVANFLYPVTNDPYCYYTQTYWDDNSAITWGTTLDNSYPIAFNSTSNIFKFGDYYRDNTHVKAYKIWSTVTINGFPNINMTDFYYFFLNANCTAETITAIGQSDQTYQIYSGWKGFYLYSNTSSSFFSVSHPNCTGDAWTVQFENSTATYTRDLNQFYNFTSNLFYQHTPWHKYWNGIVIYYQTININTTDNKYGDTSFLVNVTGTMPYGVSASYQFRINTVKNCSFVNVTWDSSQYNNITHVISSNSGQDVSYQRLHFTTNDSYCQMTTIYTIIENNVIVDSSNNSLGMRYLYIKGSGLSNLRSYEEIQYTINNFLRAKLFD